MNKNFNLTLYNMYIPHKNNQNNITSFPNQNVYNSRFYINHPQLSVNYHQKQIYEQIIREKYNTLYPSFVQLDGSYTLYDSIFQPTIEQKPTGA